MPELVVDCPRCGSRHVTCDVTAFNELPSNDWVHRYETFCVCRRCSRGSMFVLRQIDYNHRDVMNNKALAQLHSLNQVFEVAGFVSQKDAASEKPPEDLPAEIEAAFREGALCISVGCFNAAATMFRLSIDLATRAMLPPATDVTPGLNANTRRNLGLRLPWLFDNGKLPEALRDLSQAVKEEGNDGAHAGNLTQAEADDLLDFSRMLLERLYTEPARLDRAKARRDSRRAASP